MQKPITPMPVAPWFFRNDTVVLRSSTARSPSSSIRSFFASSGSVATLPRYRSGATAANPRAANRCVTISIWPVRPHHSWTMTTAGPGG